MKINSTKFLFLYRSFFFKKVIFETNNKELKEIVKALNIKNKKDRLLYIYDEIIKSINNYYVDDLCKFENDRCIYQRKTNSKNINGCCINCLKLGKHGCISENIQCKLLFCKTALGNMKLLKLNDIKITKCLTISQRLIIKMNCFNTKEQVLKDLYYGIIYSTLRNIFLDIGNKYKDKKVRS